MKKLLGTIALFKGVFGEKKSNTSTTTWGEDLADFVKMIKAAFSGKFKIKKRNMLITIAGLIYVISPLDFIPELILGPLGLVDDAAILVFVYKRITGELERFRSEAKFEEAEVVS
jgi:uncharacterized membrane protein YkvA (DUF1232 family)